MFAALHLDRVLFISSNQNDDSVFVPTHLQNRSTSQLRFDGKNIVDAMSYSEFYIDEMGEKHIQPLEKNWPLLRCAFTDTLVFANNEWRVKQDADVLQETKENTARSIADLANNTRAELTNADYNKLSSWNDKSQRAQRVITGIATEQDIAILQVESDRRLKNETPEALAQKQINKAQALAHSIAVIDGMESVALDAIGSKQKTSTLHALLDDFEKSITTQLEQLKKGN